MTTKTANRDKKDRDDAKKLINRMIAASLALTSGTAAAVASGCKEFSDGLDADNIFKLDASEGPVKALANGTSTMFKELADAVEAADKKFQKSK